MKTYLVLDLGGTNTKYAFAGEDGTLLQEGALLQTGMFPTPKSGLEELISAVEGINHRKVGNIHGIAMSVPGAVNEEKEIIEGACPISYIKGISFAREMRRYFQLPVTMENDGNCAALGELWKGSALGMKNAACIVCGTGIGGAVIMEGEIFRGTSNNGGEFGNIFVKQEQGDYCRWSQYSIVKQAKKYGKLMGDQISGKQLFELAEQEDGRARMLVDEFYETMALGCYNIQAVMDAEAILIGGGVSDSEFLVPEINQWLERIDPKGRLQSQRPCLIPCHLGSRANLCGALYYHLHRGEKRR